MGKILLAYYDYVEEKKGREGKVQLAKLTKVPSVMAGGEADSPDKIELFKKAVAEITGQPAPKLG